jgi:hypothetical protein
MPIASDSSQSIQLSADFLLIPIFKTDQAVWRPSAVIVSADD